tara:strand:+ start:272 stop:535 length:264 start_codon:yes stop_codon:yes gene_type:complete
MSTKFSDNVEITNINVVGYWNWTVHNNTCAICRNYIFESPGDSDLKECSAVVGVCNHAYHYSCISNWLNTKNVCPLCNVKWKYQKNN